MANGAGPTFTVVVPTFGRPALLDEALDSVAAQTDRDLECVVVDDASPDAARLPDDSRFRLIRRQRNGGPAAARNTGIAEAKGRWVTFLDDDDILTADRLAACRSALDRAPIVLSWVNHLGAPRTPGRRIEGPGDQVLTGTLPHLGATLVRRDVLQQFDEDFAALEDVEWWIRMSPNAVTTVPHVGYLLRRHEGPREGYGLRERVDLTEVLVDRHAGFFTNHPDALAYRWFWAGMTALRLGDVATARRALTRSLRVRFIPRRAAHLAVALLPSQLRRRIPRSRNRSSRRNDSSV